MGTTPSDDQNLFLFLCSWIKALSSFCAHYWCALVNHMWCQSSNLAWLLAWQMLYPLYYLTTSIINLQEGGIQFNFKIFIEDTSYNSFHNCFHRILIIFWHISFSYHFWFQIFIHYLKLRASFSVISCLDYLERLFIFFIKTTSYLGGWFLYHRWFSHREYYNKLLWCSMLHNGLFQYFL